MIFIFNSFSILIELINMIRSWSFEYRSRKTKIFVVWFLNIVRYVNVITLVTNSCIFILSYLRFNSLFTIVSNRLRSVKRFKNVILNSSYIRNIIRSNSFVLIINYFVTVFYNNEITYLIILLFDVSITFSILLLTC